MIERNHARDRWLGSYLNLGSGQRKFGKPWINVDVQDKFEPDVVDDIEQYLKWSDDQTAGIICLHHVVEHFGCGEADPILRECLRVLKPGGSLLVFVPDMRKLVDMWLMGQLDDQLYMTNIYGAYMDDEHDRHRWGFTTRSLTQSLLGSGFRRVVKFDWRSIEGADIARDDRWILGLEAIK